MKKIKMLVLGLCTVCASAIWAKDVVCQATGRGSTARAAVEDALVSAVQQQYGVQLTTAERSSLSSQSVSTSAGANGSLIEAQTVTVDDAVGRVSALSAKGRISRYVILSQTREGTGWTADVEVHFEQYVIGRNPNALRRMVVTTFNMRSRAFGYYGQPVDAIEWNVALANALNVRLTQTRKFTMLDRAFDQEVNAELSRLGAANASPADAIRLNQKLATDYLVVGEVTFNDVQPPAVNPLTGQAMPRASALFAEINFRVLLAPTGQLKWSDTVRLDAAQFAAADARSFISASAEAAAALICDNMMANILPFEVAAFTAGQVVIGEGGKQLRVGERFTVCALGEAVKDTRTGEVIDRIEVPVATVEVTSVGAKLSYARVVEGDAAQIVRGARLRRVVVAPSAPPPPPMSTTVAPAPNGGVVTPF